MLRWSKLNVAKCIAPAPLTTHPTALPQPLLCPCHRSLSAGGHFHCYPTDSVATFLFSPTLMKEAVQRHADGELPPIPATAKKGAARAAGRARDAAAAANGAWPGPWNDHCEVCAEGGSLLICFYCEVVVHARCMLLAFSNHRVEAGEEWACDECFEAHGPGEGAGAVGGDSSDNESS